MCAAFGSSQVDRLDSPPFERDVYIAPSRAPCAAPAGPRKVFDSGSSQLKRQAAGSFTPLLLIVLLFGVMYFMMIRPAAEAPPRGAGRCSRALGPGDEIVTIGGLHATVVAIDDDVVTVEIAPGRQRAVRPAGDRPRGRTRVVAASRRRRRRAATSEPEPIVESPSRRQPGKTRDIARRSVARTRRQAVRSDPPGGGERRRRGRRSRRRAAAADSYRETESRGTTTTGTDASRAALAVLGLIFVVLYLARLLRRRARRAASPSASQPKLGLDLIGGTQATYQASLHQRPSAAADEHGGGPEDHREPGQRPRRLRGRGRHRGQPQHRGVRSPARLTTSSRTSARPRRCGSARCSRPPATSAPRRSTRRSAAPSVAPSGGGAVRQRSGGHQQSGRLHRRSGRRRAGAEPERRPPAHADRRRASAAPVSRGPGGAAGRRSRRRSAPAAWAAASKLTDPADLSTNPAAAKLYAPFGTLTADEVERAAAADAVQRADHRLRRSSNKRPNGAIDAAASQVVPCDESGAKMFLDVAKVLGTDINERRLRSSTSSRASGWSSLNFTSDGQKKWTALTREAFTPASNDPASPPRRRCPPAPRTAWSRWSWTRRSSPRPEIQGVLTGDVADHRPVHHGRPPRCSPTRSSTARCRSPSMRRRPRRVSATLGVAQLKAGLLAAGDRHAAGGDLRVLLLPAARHGHLPEPDPVRPADLRRAGVPRPRDRLHADAGRHRRLHRVARCRGGLVRHLLRTAQGRDPRGPKPAQRGAPGLGPGPAYDHLAPTPSPSWRPWCSTSCRSAR